MTRLVFAALLCVASCASITPPTQYQRDAEARVTFLSARNDAIARCQMLGAPQGAQACGGAAGFIVAPNPCVYAGDPYADLLCHELGHVNGWPASHPQ
jgi:hypothetical protein